MLRIMPHSAHKFLNTTGRGWLLVSLFLGAMLSSFGVMASPSVALFYGSNPPLDELKAFDVVVVDPDQPGVAPDGYRHKNSELFAYVSVGEVQADKPYYRKMLPGWLLGDNLSWGSKIIDQSNPDWPRFFSEEVIAPLWKKGYRGFFLDTLDSYQIGAKTPEEKAAQEAGLKAVITEMKRRWPDAKLIMNRGFEILPDIHQDVWMVAAESLFRGWDARTRTFIEVSADDRTWLENQLRKAQKDYQLPVLVIDYLPPKQRQQARDTAKKIEDAGFIPYVTSPEMNSVGIGDIEVIPRKVLVIYNPHETNNVFNTEGLRFLGMPLAYLGLVPEYRSVEDALPDMPLAGRYAGIVTWLSDESSNREKYAAWLLMQVDQGVPVAIFGHFGVGSEAAMLNSLGLSYSEDPVAHDLGLVQSDPMMGFELPIQPNSSGLFPVRLSGDGKPLITLGSADGRRYTPAAITPWGGYVLDPYTVGELGGVDSSDRWFINPMKFLVAALKLDTSIPVPDFTTETGRRLMMVHVDGDGFANKAERPGYPFAGRVMVDDVLKRYQLPTTVSVIEGELSTTGLYPNDSAALEAIARDMYALPWVEAASHTYSHPFRWSEAQHGVGNNSNSAEGVALPIKNYTFNLKREIAGSAAYIDGRLTPAGKHVRILLWSGDCVPTEEALAEVSKDGLLNMNGGDTIITHSRSSWTNIAGPGLARGNYFQVFAPDQNEEIYTNLWTGPFYGYERVIETFQMTESPYRFKPIDIYYHPFAVTKAASLKALSKVYDWAKQQPVNMVYVSEYIGKVLDFNAFTVARTAHGYRLRGDGDLLTVRLPLQGPAVDLTKSTAIAGVAPGPSARYVSLTGESADLVFGTAPAHVPYIESANARLTRFERTPGGINFSLKGYQPLSLTLDQVHGCRLYDGNTLVNPTGQANDQFHYELNEHESLSLRLDCST